MGFVVNVAPNRTRDRLLLPDIMLASGHIVVLFIAPRPWSTLTGLVMRAIYVGAHTVGPRFGTRAVGTPV
jgi:hypothetical protein